MIESALWNRTHFTLCFGRNTLPGCILERPEILDICAWTCLPARRWNAGDLSIAINQKKNIIILTKITYLFHSENEYKSMPTTTIWRRTMVSEHLKRSTSCKHLGIAKAVSVVGRRTSCLNRFRCRAIYCSRWHHWSGQVGQIGVLDVVLYLGQLDAACCVLWQHMLLRGTAAVLWCAMRIGVARWVWLMLLSWCVLKVRNILSDACFVLCEASFAVLWIDRSTISQMLTYSALNPVGTSEASSNGWSRYRCTVTLGWKQWMWGNAFTLECLLEMIIIHFALHEIVTLQIQYEI